MKKLLSGIISIMMSAVIISPMSSISNAAFISAEDFYSQLSPSGQADIEIIAECLRLHSGVSLLQEVLSRLHYYDPNSNYSVLKANCP